MTLLTVAGILVFMGAVGKSAQFPLHIWLPDAMEGPTPVSALIHAATMVAAGVYMVVRIFPIFTPDALEIIAYIGGITAIKVGDFLDQLIALSGVTIKTHCNPDLLRPADVTLQIPCVDKFAEITGWEPQYTFEESVTHLLEYWRKKADEEVQRRSLV